MAVYKRGSKGQPVKDIQQRLLALGHYGGPVDGDFGPGTEKAVKAFQQSAGLAADGKVGKGTWAALFESREEPGSVTPEPQPASERAEPQINRSQRLEDKDYIQTETRKDLIVLHHTVGGSAKSTIDYWKTDPQRVGTAYVIERNGEIYEVFEPTYWAFHLGLKGTGGAVDKRSVGIELASEGGLTLRDDKLYCFDRVSDRTLFTQEHYECGMPWRGYRFFDAYSDAQITAVAALIDWLCGRLDIPRQTPANHLDADDAYREFEGILGHHHLRPDKSDVHPGFQWQRVINQCGLALI